MWAELSCEVPAAGRFPRASSLRGFLRPHSCLEGLLVFELFLPNSCLFLCLSLTLKRISLLLNASLLCLYLTQSHSPLPFGHPVSSLVCEQMISTPNHHLKKDKQGSHRRRAG